MRTNRLRSALLLLLSLCLVLALAACGGKKKGDKDDIGKVEGGPGGSQPPLACSHVPGMPKRENERIGSCTEPSSYDEVTYCTSTCGAELSRVTRTIPAPGHSYDSNGYCSACGTSWPASTGLDFYYYDDGTCSVSGMGSCTDTDIVIPYASPTGERVVGIDSSAFDMGSKTADYVRIRTVKIPPTVTFIADRAFSACDGLVEVSIPDSVTRIGSIAFGGCTSLTEIYIPASVNSLGERVFAECPALERIVVDEENTTYKNIDGNNVYSNDGTTLLIYAPGNPVASFIVPDGVTTIAAQALRENDRIVSLILPDSVESIGNQAFYYCSSLVSVTLGEGLTSIGSWAFDGCFKLVEVVNRSALDISAGSTSHGYVGCFAKEIHSEESRIEIIDGYVFYSGSDGNYLLGYVGDETVLVLPDGYKGGNYAIYDYAFYGRSDLKSVTLSPSVTEIGTYAFAYCDGLSSMVIPEGVSRIGDYAFRDDRGLVSVTLPTSLTYIGYDAFYGCMKLVEVVNNSPIDITIGYSSNGYVAYYAIHVHSGESEIKNVGGYLFYPLPDYTFLLGYVGDATELVLPDSYADAPYRIYGYAFYNQSGITSLTVGAGVERINPYAFYGCTGLSEIYFNAVNMSDLSSGNHVFSYAGESTDGVRVVIGKDVTRVPAYLFSPETGLYGTNVVSVEFEDGSACEYIGTCAFYNCNSLKSVEIPESVSSIGGHAFGFCTKLETVYFNTVDLASLGEYNCVFSGSGTAGGGIRLVVGKNVTKLPSYLFRPEDGSNTPNLTVIEFEEGSLCESIGSYAFCGCLGIRSLTIPESVKTIGTYAFYGCRNLTEINFNAIDMNDMASYNYAFSEAGHELGGISVMVGAGVTHIPSYLFCPDSGYAAPRLLNLAFEDGSLCESIGSYAFYGCSYLDCVTIPERVTSIGSYAFYGCTGLQEICFNATSMSNLASDDNVFGCAGQSVSGISVIFGSGVQRVPTYLFASSSTSGSPNVTEVEFAEDSVCYGIGNYAFYYCASLREIALPSSLTSIGACAFYACSALGSAELPGGVSNIGDSAFRYCTALKYVTVPVSVEGIGASAFEFCDNLTIFCEADAKPSSWSSSWNNSSCPVVWGYGSEEYTYTFETNGAGDIDPIVSSTLITLPELIRDEYVFLGWYDNEALSGTAVGEVYYSAENHTLYAKWLHESEILDGTSIERAFIKYADGSPTAVSITTGGQVVYFKLTATTSKNYTIYSSGTYDTYVLLYASNGEYVTYNDDGGSNNNFRISYYLSAGESIYIGAKMWSGSTTGTYYLYVE